jgi:putative FmdB family regulatory protein
MPTYQYHCEQCEKTFERTETISEHEAAKLQCPKCGSKKVSVAFGLASGTSEISGVYDPASKSWTVPGRGFNPHRPLQSPQGFLINPTDRRTSAVSRIGA